MTLSDCCIPVGSFPVNNMGIQPVFSYDDAELQKADAFLLGYVEDRNSTVSCGEESVNAIREKLYSLHGLSKSLNVIDLGTCKRGDTVQQSYEMLQYVVERIALYQKPIVIIGGTQESVCSIASASFRGVAFPAMCFIDAKIDWNADDDFSSENYLKKLCEDNPRMRVLHVGGQEYLSSRDALSWFSKNYFYAMRLGECNADITKAEPLIRDAQLISFDMNVVRYSDSPAGQNVNGLYSEYACQCAWNAGYSPRMNTFMLSEFDVKKDVDGISTQLAAQIIWHVFDGISQGKHESCDFFDGTYEILHLKHAMIPQDITFYTSKVSKTVWMEVPIGTNHSKSRYIPCSPADYEQCVTGYIPDVWMTELHRLRELFG